MGQQSRSVIVGEDGKKYYDVPGMQPIPVEDIDGPPKSAYGEAKLSDTNEKGDVTGHPALRGFVQGAAESPMAQFLKRSSPEIAAGLTAALAPVSGGASLALPPIAAGATEAAKEYFDTGAVDPMSVATRTGLNAVPGVVGKVAGRFLPGSGTLSRAVEGAAQGDGWLSTIAKGLKGAMGGGQASIPVQTAAAGGAKNLGTTATIQRLEEMLQSPSLNVTAKAAVLQSLRRLQAQQSGNVAQSLRGVMGTAQGLAGER